MGYHKINKKNKGQSGNAPMQRLVQGAHSRRHQAHVAAQDALQPNKHTTDVQAGQESGPSMASIVHNNDLDEMLALADLAGRDYSAERENLTVIAIEGRKVAVDPTQKAVEAAEAREMHTESVRCPRRPPWTTTMAADELDYRERESFLAWRRKLAEVEEDPRLMVTPFEKNLEVWRQLWRVLERSDLVVQVVDARDPELYRCQDLEDYVQELDPNKQCVLLLNKADLLPEALRLRWAKHFAALGVQYIWWSAKAAEDLAAADDDDPPEDPTPPAPDLETPDPQELESFQCKVLSREELMAKLEWLAAQAAGLPPQNERGEDVDGAEGAGVPVRRAVAGFVGYPNVGKSSTLNALVGVHKASVAATPGKTKHFQTINISPSFMLCDSPGLVFPQFSQSKADMVLAGVLPIDRLTDMRDPVDLIARRVPRTNLENVYGIFLPRPADHEDPHRPPSAAELLRAFAAARGYVVQMGRPDEMRAGRILLKDIRDGKLNCCRLPSAQPSAAEAKMIDFWTPQVAPKRAKERANTHSEATTLGQELTQLGSLGLGGAQQDAINPRRLGVKTAGQDLLGIGAQLSSQTQMSSDLSSSYISKQESKGKEVRASHKFQHKIARSKGNRGQEAAAGGDGGMLLMGKRGGIRPASMQA
mmetsp:Transcript_33338/g.62724  ORF Transcript_33338/g.62724 Transcript_33338/m.62724 type:complete len:647 (-) Transcript_33338:380-2320(-)